MAKERENLQAQKDNGELQTKNSYVFYKIFLFISGLSLVLCMAAVVDLIYHCWRLNNHIKDIRNKNKEANNGRSPQSPKHNENSAILNQNL